jgi:hypothetical protein
MLALGVAILGYAIYSAFSRSPGWRRRFGLEG